MSTNEESSVVLAHPTPAQFERQYSLNGIEWRGALSQEAYMRRERYLSKQGIAADNSGQTYWALIDKSADPESDKILAGCESLRKRALVSKDGKVVEVTAHAIASVFTPPDARGKSYASKMMREIASVLKTWQSNQSPCLFSVLYSDIGKNFYARAGWQAFPSAHVHLSPDASPEPPTGVVRVEASPLYAEDLESLCKTDEVLIRDQLARHRGGVAVALIPDHKTIIWHHAREYFVSNELHGRAPSIKGAIATFGQGQRVWAIWSNVFYNPNPSESKRNVLYILRFVIEGDDGASKEEGDVAEARLAAIAAVLRVAQREAHAWKMEKVEMWNPTSPCIQAAQSIDPQARVIQRDTESIASLQWYGDAADEGKIEWIANEKFGWC